MEMRVSDYWELLITGFGQIKLKPDYDYCKVKLGFL
jgi:hypothetical protein